MKERKAIFPYKMIILNHKEKSRIAKLIQNFYAENAKQQNKNSCDFRTNNSGLMRTYIKKIFDALANKMAEGYDITDVNKISNDIYVSKGNYLFYLNPKIKS